MGHQDGSTSGQTISIPRRRSQNQYQSVGVGLSQASAHLALLNPNAQLWVWMLLATSNAQTLNFRRLVSEEHPFLLLQATQVPMVEQMVSAPAQCSMHLSQAALHTSQLWA